MQSQQFLKSIGSAPLARVYLFLGDADYLIEEAWKRLLESALPLDARKLGGKRFQARAVGALSVIEQLTTLPMFGSKRLFLLERIDEWNKADRDILRAAIPRIVASTCLVATTRNKKGVEDFFAAVEAAGTVVNFQRPGQDDLPRWLVVKAREKGKALSPMAASLMAELTGADLYRLESELDKVCAYVGESERIEVSDVEATVGGERSFSTFDLLDQIRMRQAGRAAASLKSLGTAGEAPLKILGLLVWNLRQLWQVKEGLDDGLSIDEIAGRMKSKPFSVKKISRQAAGFSEADFLRIHRAICDTDLAIKSTGAAPELVLENLILSLCLQ